METAMSDDAEIARLRAENARLTSLLAAHGIESPTVVPIGVQRPAARLSADQKVALFRRLFRGRTDV